jgi:hypothetical protein
MWLRKLIFVHLFGSMIALQREIFDTQLGPIGRFCRWMEILLVGMYNFSII